MNLKIDFKVILIIEFVFRLPANLQADADRA